MSCILNGLNNIVRPCCRNGNSIQFQQIRTKFPDWKMLKDYRKRMTVKQYGPERFCLNMIRKNQVLPPELREMADKEIAAYPRNAAINRIVSRCVLTSRPRGVVNQYRVSRIVFRELADKNQLSGIQRAMWYKENNNNDNNGDKENNNNNNDNDKKEKEEKKKKKNDSPPGGEQASSDLHPFP